ncbi:MAG: phenylalanine--tRNA ligase subunit beta, partial [Polyangiaceae bacterium]|nr:phenylalanine--tRNA ligase subunit beta [Polyangiaceae bacterium]
SHEVGTRFIDAFPEARDVVFEIDVTPNRPDALGHIGVARDLAAFYGIELKLPTPGQAEEDGENVSTEVTVVNHDMERCPRYGGALVRGIQVKPSPEWMQWRLHRLGIRPISNIVDITNWLLLEYGQPLHAFDLAKIQGRKIEVRRARSGEKIATLDGEERELCDDDLLICDAAAPTALAGIMGGAESEIGAATEDVFIECAYFQPRGVRRTARRQAMHTESSHRFERGTDSEIAPEVLLRARNMMAVLGGGRPAPGSVRADGEEIALPSIQLRSARLDALLGTPVDFKEAVKILSRLGFAVEFMGQDESGLSANIRGASHRPDVTIEADLIEEVARIRGLDEIPTILPAIPPQRQRVAGGLERKAIETAVALGLSEALTYSFVSPADLAAIGAPESVVSMSNPLTEERSVLRTSMAPGLLEALKRARRRGEREIRLFSVGSIFLPIGSDGPVSESRPRDPVDEKALPLERPTFCALLAGPRPGFLELTPEEYDVYDAKAIAVEMVERMTGRRALVASTGGQPRAAHYHPRGAGAISVDGMEVGLFGPLHPDVVEQQDLDGSALLIELDLSLIEELGHLIPRYQKIPKLPAITRDISLVLDEAIPASQVAASFQAAAGELCESVEVATEFRGGSVPEGQRSLTFRAVYRDPQARVGAEGARTLRDKEVDQVQAQALEKAQQEFGAALRS